jgi:DNA ligase-1
VNIKCVEVGNLDYNQLSSKVSETFDAFEAIRGVSATSGKAEILEQNRDNDVLKSLLFLTYNPFLVYNIKKIPKHTPDDSRHDEYSAAKNLLDFIQLLKKLKDRIITGNEAIDTIQEFFSKCNEREYEWYSKVIRKDLKIGLADKGINRVFPALIPAYDVLLAEKLELVDLGLDTPTALKTIPQNIIEEYKLDGMRLNIFVYPDEVVIRTRNGKVVYGYQNLAEEAQKKLPCNHVYDGELMSREFENTVARNAEDNSLTEPSRECFSDLMTSAFSLDNNKDGVFNLFDVLTIEEWNARQCTHTLRERKQWIKDNLMGVSYDNIKIVPWSKEFHRDSEQDRADMVDLFHRFLTLGYEGAMLKDFDAYYEFKRSKSLLKMKYMLSIDLEILDVYEGDKGSKYEGMLGGVYCEYRGNQLGVGSGWSDSERQLYWEHPELLVGKTIEIQYQSETQNKQGGYSLSFPVKKCIREDKS